MISALDSSVLLDVVFADPDFCGQSRAAIESASRAGALVISPVVAAEIRVVFKGNDQLHRMLLDFGIHVPELNLSDALRAGAIHRHYRETGGTRQRLIADFLIGAHALRTADRLIVRDRGFFRSYFPELSVWYPDAP